MSVERSAGIIFFRNTVKGRKYLVLRSSYHGKGNSRADFWDFPKGLLDKREKGIDAAKRESREEAGITKFKLKKEFKATVRYFVRRDWNRKPVLKFVAMFLAKSGTARVKLSWEHDKFEWLSYKKAHERITKPEMKKALERAEKVLLKR